MAATAARLPAAARAKLAVLLSTSTPMIRRCPGDLHNTNLRKRNHTHRTLNQDTERTNTHSNRKEPKPKTLKQKRIKVRHPQIRQSTSPGTRQAQKDRAHLGLILRHFGFKPPQQIAAPDKLQRPEGRSAEPTQAAPRADQTAPRVLAGLGLGPPCQSLAGSGPSCAALPPAECRRSPGD